GQGQEAGTGAGTGTGGGAGVTWIVLELVIMDRVKAVQLIERLIFDPYTRTHSLATEAVTRALAARLGQDVELWGLTGLLHDLDYDIVGDDRQLHARLSVDILKSVGGLPEIALDAILAHNGDNLGISCKTLLDHGVTSGESITGIILAMALVLPSKSLLDVKATSIRKRLTQSRFAASISRFRISQYAGLGLSQEEFISIAVEAMQKANLKWPGGPVTPT
ncbi:MAG TPA: HD domain-containing protein, partial [Myxococcota bacterium]|nr:HD domain-containing protein [Myxococcota bacterium]